MAKTVYTRLGGMWKGKSGTPCVCSGRMTYDELMKVIEGSGLFGKKLQLVLFQNDRKQNDRSPDFNLCLAEDTYERPNLRHVVGDAPRSEEPPI